MKFTHLRAKRLPFCSPYKIKVSRSDLAMKLVGDVMLGWETGISCADWAFEY